MKPNSLIDVIRAKARKADVIRVLRTIYDPELPVNIYDLGLIYDIDTSADNVVQVQLTLTSPACPVAESLPPLVEARVRSIPGIEDVDVELVWDPPWSPERMSEAARLELDV